MRKFFNLKIFTGLVKIISPIGLYVLLYKGKDDI